MTINLLRKALIAILVCAGTIGGASAAAQTVTPPADPLPEFRDAEVVTAERGKAAQTWIPAATSAIDAAALSHLPAVSLGEFLSFVPGFRVQQAALFAGRPVVSARGFFGGGEAEYVALLVDGVRVADAESGLVDWSAIAGSSITRLEAARGPGASLYGDAAIGGVIQVLTGSPASRNVFTISGGSLGTLSFDGTSRWQRRSLSGFVSAAGMRTDGITAHSDASELTFGSAVGGTVRRVAWRWTLTGVGRDQDDPGVLSVAQRERGVSFDPLFGHDNRSRRTLLSAVTLRSAGTKWSQQSRVAVDVRNEDGIRTILLAPGLGDTRSRDLSASGFSGTFEFERTLGSQPNSVVRAGVDLARDHVDTSYRNVQSGAPIGDAVASADGSRIRTGAFGAASWMPAPRVRLFAALRWDRLADNAFVGGRDESTEAWSPRAGVVVQPAWLRGAAVFAQASRAFKAPTLDQLFDPRPYPDFRGGSFTISNNQLLAQRASNVEAGVTGGGRVRWSVLAYRMNVSNEIDFDARTFSYGNIGRSRHLGVEAEVQGSIAGRVRPSATYAWTDVRGDESEAQLKNVPRHQLTVGASATFAGAVEAFVSVRRAWDAFLDEENTLPIESAAMVDLRIRRAFGRAALFADVLNAFDRRYDEFGYALTDFRGARVGYVYPGQPRVVRAGLTIELK